MAGRRGTGFASCNRHDFRTCADNEAQWRGNQTAGIEDESSQKMRIEMNWRQAIGAAVLAAAICMGASAHAQTTVKHIQTAASPIATAVWAGDTLYVSGQLASPITPADPAKGTAAVYGDTKAQATSEILKIQAILKEQGLTLGDVVMMHVFLAGDPDKGGKLDF